MEIKLLDNIYLKEDNTFDLDSALKYSAKIAGVCYLEDTFDSLLNEDEEKTIKRMNNTLNSGHYSVYDHIFVSLDIRNIPKFLAMIINNEKQYTTSEKSFRYTKLDENSNVSKKEIELYNKWYKIFYDVIKEEYSKLSEFRIKKLAGENARYLLSNFVNTNMIYTTSLRQINNIASFMKKFIDDDSLKSREEKKLKVYMNDFLDNLDNLNLLDERLMTNNKNRHLSLIKENLNSKDIFDNIYQVNYSGSLAYLGQAQRHRTLNYTMSFKSEDEYYIPEIIKNKKEEKEWLDDLNDLRDIIPQALLVNINESGTYEDFINKCKERLCVNAQLEIRLKTRELLEKYLNNLEENHPIKEAIEKRMNGCSNTMEDFNCKTPCKYHGMKALVRKI